METIYILSNDYMSLINDTNNGLARDISKKNIHPQDCQQIWESCPSDVLAFTSFDAALITAAHSRIDCNYTPGLLKDNIQFFASPVIFEVTINKEALAKYQSEKQIVDGEVLGSYLEFATIPNYKVQKPFALNTNSDNTSLWNQLYSLFC